jgi:hypothetical protein
MAISSTFGWIGVSLAQAVEESRAAQARERRVIAFIKPPDSNKPQN